MTSYERALRLLTDHPHVRTWPELAAACERARAHRPIAWDFPLRAAQAVGGQAEAAIPAVAANTCTHMALILIDDLLDEDPRGAQHRLGAGRAANLAAGLLALGTQVLLESNCSERLRAARALNDMILRTGYGQDLDVQNLQTEDAYWQVTRAKSSPYFGTALCLGALFGERLDAAERLQEFGELFGEIMQIHDDLNDCLAVPANVDWIQGRSPLPILFAQTVAHPERERFMKLRSQVEDAVILEEVQTILVRCGAISYSVNELILRQKKAEKMLAAMRLADPQPLAQLLEEAIAPVQHLFAKVGAEFPVAK
ncbi:MAG: polyprenyl synthetase family protein [Anaerolineales bacterium]